MNNFFKPGDIILERYEISQSKERNNSYKAYDKINKIDVSIIKIPSNIASDAALIKSIKELHNSMKQLAHPNILSIYQFEYDYKFGHYFIIMEYFDSENLYDYLMNQDNQLMTVEESFIILEDVLKGLKYAHQEKILHLGLSPNNILINHQGDIKIDFTNFVSLPSEQISSIKKLYLRRMNLYNNSDDYEFPMRECMKDIYLLGVIFYGLSSEFKIFKELEINLISDDYPFNIKKISFEQRKILKKLLSSNLYKHYCKKDDFFPELKNILISKKKKFFRISLLLAFFILLLIASLFTFNMSEKMPMHLPMPKSSPPSTSPDSVQKSHTDYTKNSSKSQYNNSNSQYSRINKYKYDISKVRGPLPHSGFFMRRNNEYGTTMELGIKKLIDQGVMIGHENIRFDDFVASNSDLIPFPQYGEALNICYGIAEIPLKQKPDPNATHYLEIALKTSKNKPPDIVNNKNDTTPPVAYVFVIDHSSSMEGQKLDSVKTSIRELIQSLKHDDIVGIISFNESVSTVLKTTLKKNLPVHDLSRIISNIEASGGTDINLGLSFGLDEMSRYEDYYSIKQLFLFSDGNPTSGETNWLNIRKNIVSQIRKGIHVSTFAFGSDANSSEMDALAGMTAGKHMFVTNLDSVSDYLKNDLKRREYITAINIQMKININKDIKILHLYGHDQITDPLQRRAIQTEIEKTKMKAMEQYGVKSQPDIINDEAGIRIFVPDLGQNETYWVVFELSLENSLMDSIGSATINYIDAFKKENKSHNLIFDSENEIPAEIVVQHGLGLWTSEVIFDALEDLYQEDLPTAKSRIENHLELMNPTNLVLESNQIIDDRITLKKFLSIADNLGKYISNSDARDQNSYFMFNLNQFGQSKAGWIRRTMYSDPNQ